VTYFACLDDWMGFEAPYSEAQCNQYSQYGYSWEEVTEVIIPDSLTPVATAGFDQPGFPATVDVTVTDDTGSTTESVTLSVD